MDNLEKSIVAADIFRFISHDFYESYNHYEYLRTFQDFFCI